MRQAAFPLRPYARTQRGSRWSPSPRCRGGIYVAFWQSLGGRWVGGCSGVYERQRYLPPGALGRRHVAVSCLAQPGAPATCGPPLGADSPPPPPNFVFSFLFFPFFPSRVVWAPPMSAVARLFLSWGAGFPYPTHDFPSRFADVAGERGG